MCPAEYKFKGRGVSCWIQFKGHGVSCWIDSRRTREKCENFREKRNAKKYENFAKTFEQKIINYGLIKLLMLKFFWSINYCSYNTVFGWIFFAKFCIVFALSIFAKKWNFAINENVITFSHFFAKVFVDRKPYELQNVTSGEDFAEFYQSF